MIFRAKEHTRDYRESETIRARKRREPWPRTPAEDVGRRAEQRERPKQLADNYCRQG